MLPMHFSQFSRIKYVVRRVIEARKTRIPCFFVVIPTIKYYHT